MTIYLEAITICLIFFGCSYCYSEVNGTSVVRTILKGILFECSSKSSQEFKTEKNCKSYLAISIRADPSLHISRLHQFLILDEIYVANRFSIAKLVAPYVIEISRGEPLMMHPLRYDKSVTAEELENTGLFDEKSEIKFISQLVMQNTAKENTNNANRHECAGGHGNRRYKSAEGYSVFNTNSPTPFMVTTVKIYQKRYSTWWKLAPSITVDSYSGFCANDNLSVWFKYHVNIFQLSKSINRLKNFKLLIPHKHNSEKLISIAEQANELIYYPQNFLQEHDFNNNYMNPLQKPPTVSRAAQNPQTTARTLLESCPYNSSILCVNILDDVVAGYSIKIQLPFVENAFIKPNVFKVKIINVITDATVEDTVKVSINLVNEGFAVHEFVVNVDCLERITINRTYNTVRLLPHIGETIQFFLPFMFEKGNQASRKTYCKIQVKTLLTVSTKRSLNQQKYAPMDTQKEQIQRTVTTRKITVIPHQRCLCVWKCSCHCLAKLETYVDFNICQELDSSSQSKAGLLINSNYYELHEKDPEDAANNIQSIIFNCCGFAILIVLFMGFLGFCKAIIGICIPFVDRWGYDYLQPGRTYNDTSKFRHFWINLFYFILLPFLICCNCFTPSAEDLLASNSESFIAKMYIYVYEVFYDNIPTIIIIDETETSLQTDEY